MIFPGPLGKVVIWSDESLQLYDVAARKVLHELPAADVKQLYWAPNFTHAAVVTKTRNQ
jgi:hypothetical protein